MKVAHYQPIERFRTHGAASRALGKVVAFLAVTSKSATQAEQEKAFASADYIMRAGRLGPTEIMSTLAHGGIALEPGDVLMFHDPTCLAVETGTIIRLFADLLQRQISLKFVDPTIEIVPSDPPSTAQTLLNVLDRHWRFIHGLKTHGGVKGRTGRRPSLETADREKVQNLLNDASKTMAGIALELGVSRAALYGFLEREGLSRSR